MENFAQRVRQLRKESGKTQTQMAAVFEISARQYQNYEGGGHYPDVPGLMKMADYFGVTTDYLLGRSDQRSSGDTGRRPAATGTSAPAGGWSSGMHPPFSFPSCGKENGPCTVQKKRPLRRAPARSRLRATGVGGSVQAPILACLRARFSLLQVCNCRPVADGAEVVGVVIALSLLLFSLPLAVPRGTWCNGRMWTSARKHKPLRPPG